jgi:single-strand DNA-binding protein
MIKVTISGNVVADGELRHTGKGEAMLSFRVAVNNRERNADGEYEDQTYWYRIMVMRPSEYLQRNVLKGAKVVVGGTQTAKIYEAKSGPQISFDIAFPDTVEIYGKLPRQDDSDEDAKPTRSASNGNAKPKSAGAKMLEESDPALDDLPFRLPRRIQEPWLYWRAP